MLCRRVEWPLNIVLNIIKGVMATLIINNYGILKQF